MQCVVTAVSLRILWYDCFKLVQQLNPAKELSGRGSEVRVCGVSIDFAADHVRVVVTYSRDRQPGLVTARHVCEVEEASEICAAGAVNLVRDRQWLTLKTRARVLMLWNFRTLSSKVELVGSLCRHRRVGFSILLLVCDGLSGWRRLWRGFVWASSYLKVSWMIETLFENKFEKSSLLCFEKSSTANAQTK